MGWCNYGSDSFHVIYFLGVMALCFITFSGLFVCSICLFVCLLLALACVFHVFWICLCVCYYYCSSRVLWRAYLFCKQTTKYILASQIGHISLQRHLIRHGKPSALQSGTQSTAIMVHQL